MATIRERNGSYQIKVSAGYNKDGHQVTKTMTWKPKPGMTQKQTEKELARVAAEFETKILKGNFADSTKTKLSDFTKQYLEFAVSTLSPSTLVMYKRAKNTKT